MDSKLNSLLKWSTENSSSDPSSAPAKPIDPAALSALFGGPSDADLMKMSMAAILSSDPEITLEDKLVAFDNFEQLIENLDNANNIEALALWPSLLGTLSDPAPDIRTMAAWCIGTAIQNNAKAQERCLAHGGIPLLVRLARAEAEEVVVRRKAVYALSSACRNYQPAMDVLVGELRGEEVEGMELGEKVDAADMGVCDGIFGALRDAATNCRVVGKNA
ncbi:uncharacterized protein L3040_008557 [Drepanopeziza brunnea f. sp. 'multigermtubi']|uniref:Hsp70 nucleotide exchange factor n=1 Tax=Marssonina brunnea f. sp. multigermtubi (strain MB_m1) TaxID=1072389 RepID=K1Y1F1_MARBU|nr:hsp70 nucleotide exchange factor [Drepanopeziza brunnea f. sp. 'multigermtubi' MB_m1]EKD18969.1 hsp70 nucleotide exchange factor [Drepanopeziza brunnea f. sp. 'multigermtubi' MB_m1]KAJ5033442.1 hypothetical protein L3040_008557 [Drepanopeziza brunnea f. sp. 'multigermtubi']